MLSVKDWKRLRFETDYPDLVVLVSSCVNLNAPEVSVKLVHLGSLLAERGRSASAQRQTAY
jgi:hypothetical protein